MNNTLLLDELEEGLPAADDQSTEVKDDSDEALTDLLEELMEADEADEADGAEADPLDALLEESMGAVREAKEAKAARERAKRGGQTAAEQAEDAERIRRWELANEWKAVANVAVFDRYTCACGSSQLVFSQLMVRQSHRHLRDSQRWQASTKNSAGLPSETVVRERAVMMCAGCAPAHGFNMQNPTIWKE